MVYDKRVANNFEPENSIRMDRKLAVAVDEPVLICSLYMMIAVTLHKK